ncbi:hypothetical protein Bca4012_080651 [Brassica carinata]
MLYNTWNTEMKGYDLKLVFSLMVILVPVRFRCLLRHRRGESPVKNSDRWKHGGGVLVFDACLLLPFAVYTCLSTCFRPGWIWLGLDCVFFMFHVKSFEVKRIDGMVSGLASVS